MGRKATWTEPELLRTVMAVFRRKGFAHTSVRDLEEASGLHPGSIYKAYGNKEGLFTAALAAYNEQVAAERVRTHLDETDPPLRGLHAYFLSTFDGDEEANPGCLLTNTAVEAPALAGVGRDGVTAGLELIEAGFRRVLERAVAAGELAADTPAGQLAGELLALYQGVLVLVRFGTAPAKLAGIVTHALPALLSTHIHEKSDS
ncbi:TetR family transcriptional regulator [Actinoplanes cyaneus]|uniref:TetR family transcriptional regulator n=1 Tax=Actinoplanes cyaneus TaxID=52696 RepID=A0A919M817_9ACTN|nr:TetR/AcrR family transcriptional regulator [Actinoplanes cyaneus]MCW2139473.1 transcriptional regulator, TetR family [Actinoplanes cyaneus]GID66004.1 TetR family transcriptional regulator [Actinoplanes cyaneus]